MGLAELAPARTRIECSGATHTLLWRDGALETPDHPDPEAERALAALGGARCRCVELLDAWLQCRDEPRTLVLGPRGHESPARSADEVSWFVAGFRPVNRAVTTQIVNASRAARGGGRRTGPPSARTRWSSGATGTPGASDGESGADPLLELLNLGGAMALRLVAGAAVAMHDRLDDPQLRPQLYAALYGRVLVSLSRWLGEVPAFELELIAPAAAPSLREDGDLLIAELPFHWLIDVWAAGLDTVGGRFTLAATPEATGGRQLLMIDQLMQLSSLQLAPR
jgi:hypothetical protein